MSWHHRRRSHVTFPDTAHQDLYNSSHALSSSHSFYMASSSTCVTSHPFVHPTSHSFISPCLACFTSICLPIRPLASSHSSFHPFTGLHVVHCFCPCGLSCKTWRKCGVCGVLVVPRTVYLMWHYLDLSHALACLYRTYLACRHLQSINDTTRTRSNSSITAASWWWSNQPLCPVAWDSNLFPVMGWWELGAGRDKQATEERAASVEDDADGHLIYRPGDVLQARCTHLNFVNFSCLGWVSIHPQPPCPPSVIELLQSLAHLAPFSILFHSLKLRFAPNSYAVMYYMYYVLFLRFWFCNNIFFRERV